MDGWQTRLQVVLDGAQGRELTEGEWAQVVALMPCEAKGEVSAAVERITLLRSETQGCSETQSRSVRAAEQSPEYALCPQG